MVLVNPNAAPDVQGQDLLQRSLDNGAQQRTGINQFFGAPARQDEINNVVGAGMDRAMRGLGNQLTNRSRQEAFARARSGNVGGSFQASQQAGVHAAGQVGSADITSQFDAQRDNLQRALMSQQQQELMQSFGVDQFSQQGIDQILASLNTAEQGASARFGLDEQRRSQEAFANDELSRAFGNLVNVGGNIFEHVQQNRALATQAEQNARLR